MTFHAVEQTDGQLLRQFTDRKDEVAFAELMRRYGRLVFGLCRHILRHEQEAEDTFQATFLVLARSSGHIRSPEALPNWLCGVATRLATRASASASRRRAREAELKDDVPAAPAPGREADELKPFLHQEIGRLPDKYRIPLVLCYLEGKTNEEVARHLGCSVGTIYSRLARARKRLRDRLTRRGLAVSVALVVVALAALPQDVSAAVPPELVTATARLTALFASGQVGSQAVHARAVRMAERYLGAAAWRRGIVTAILLLVVCGMAGAAWHWLFRPARPGVAESDGNRAVPTREEQLIRNGMQGIWVLRSMTVNDQRVPDAGLPELRARLEVEGQRLTMTSVAFAISGPYRIDAASKPMRVDFADNWNAARGRFELEGSTLTMCLRFSRTGEPAPDYPARIGPGPGITLLVYEREKR